MQIGSEAIKSRYSYYKRSVYHKRGTKTIQTRDKIKHGKVRDDIELA